MKNSIFVAPVFHAALLAMILVPARSSALADEPQDRVLRHAVFFSFNPEATEQEVASVVEAFEKLPSQIDTIVDFKYGQAVPDARLSDGFTHAFLLTFNDEKGRDVYLPHPAHKAFGEVLRPIMKDVFVVDYWGTKSDVQRESALMHPVFFKFRDETSEKEIKGIEEGFAELANKIKTVKHFEWGKNNSPETHDDGFTHCFMVTFDGPAGLATYLPHPAHQAFVKTLDSVEQIRVIDFSVE